MTALFAAVAAEAVRATSDAWLTLLGTGGLAFSAWRLFAARRLHRALAGSPSPDMAFAHQRASGVP